MVKLVRLLVPLTAVLLLLPSAPAQRRGRDRGGDRQGRERGMQQRFESSGLKPGDPFPEVDLFDARGKPFNTKSFKGKYTVIVSGCLT